MRLLRWAGPAGVYVVGGGLFQKWPPALEVLQAWSALFRCVGTFSNYLGYVRTGCLVVKCDTKVLYILAPVGAGWSHVGCVAQVFDDPALRRAKASVVKRGCFQPREKMFIQRCAPSGVLSLVGTCTRLFCCRAKVEALLRLAESHPRWKDCALLFLFSYIFLLRLPSEALPLRMGPGLGQSILTMKNGKLVLALARRWARGTDRLNLSYVISAGGKTDPKEVS